jgi:hypothetical protein
MEQTTVANILVHASNHVDLNDPIKMDEVKEMIKDLPIDIKKAFMETYGICDSDKVKDEFVVEPQNLVEEKEIDDLQKELNTYVYLRKKHIQEENELNHIKTHDELKTKYDDQCKELKTKYDDQCDKLKTTYEQKWAEQKNMDKLRYLEKSLLDAKENTYKLLIDLERNDSELFKKLYEKYKFDNILHYLAMRYQPELFEHFIKDYNMNIDNKNEHGESQFIQIIKTSNDHEKHAIFLNHKFDIEAKDNFGCTALDYAINACYNLTKKIINDYIEINKKPCEKCGK